MGGEESVVVWHTRRWSGGGQPGAGAEQTNNNKYQHTPKQQLKYQRQSTSTSSDSGRVRSRSTSSSSSSRGSGIRDPQKNPKLKQISLVNKADQMSTHFATKQQHKLSQK
ncbi:uncharacterized protein Dana_GF27049 [Drosophila ananassae]|uniref:Uncharacterized protein n=1 Tax=Drosophila ananassae TaxID=7217 RepID=A0A0P8Y506_DROAN|nr:uncharacterized protein Dana_GF27049 [Drosophila ananassae]